MAQSLRLPVAFDELSVCRWHECERECRDLCDQDRLLDDIRSGLSQASQDRDTLAELRRMALDLDADAAWSRISDRDVCDWLLDQFQLGRLRLCEAEPIGDYQAELPRAPSAPPPPPAIPVQRWVEPPPPPPVARAEPATFSSQFDPIAAVAVLKKAAVLGWPVCEECEKANLARPVTPPPPAPSRESFNERLDIAAMVSTLIEAASLAAPFCEECEKAGLANPDRVVRVVPLPPPELVDVLPLRDSFNERIDAAAMARALLNASASGAAFCEECERARREGQSLASGALSG